MADPDEIASFLADFDLGPDAVADDAPRIWFERLEGTCVVFSVADGENVEGADLAAIAQRAMDALAAAFPDEDFRSEVREQD
jgi:hypothetical protein